MKLRFFTISIMIVFLFGCEKAHNMMKSTFTPNDPVAVANAFWSLALSVEPNDATKYATDNDIGSHIVGHTNEDTFLLGTPIEQDSIYFIETTVLLSREGRVITIPMHTVVVSKKGKFLVDFYATRQSVFDATVSNSIKYFRDTTTYAAKYVKGVFPQPGDDSKESLKWAHDSFDEMTKSVKAQFVEEVGAKLTN